MATISTPRSQSAAYESLLRPHLDKLFRVAYRYTQSQEDAEDLLQDLIVKMYTRYDELVGIERLDIWLAKVMYRMFIDDTRRYQRSPVRALADLDEGSEFEYENYESEFADPALQHEEADFHAQVRKALSVLKPEHQLLLKLFDIEGHTLEEIGEMLTLPLGTVKSRLHRARAALREQLKPSPETEDGNLSRTCSV